MKYSATVLQFTKSDMYGIVMHPDIKEDLANVFYSISYWYRYESIIEPSIGANGRKPLIRIATLTKIQSIRFIGNGVFVKVQGDTVKNKKKQRIVTPHQFLLFQRYPHAKGIDFTDYGYGVYNQFLQTVQPRERLELSKNIFPI